MSDRPPPVDLHISIVDDNGGDRLLACLRSLTGASGGLVTAITVVDNCSDDDSPALAEGTFPEVAIHRNDHRRGFGANHNTVLRPVVAGRTARYLLILNDDTVLDPGCLDHLVAAMDARPGVGAMVPEVVDDQGRRAPGRLAWPTARSSWDFDRRTTAEPPDPDGWLQGCCLILRPEALEQVGCFDERFFLFYEDIDLSRRLVEGGWELGTCREARLTHTGHASVLRPDLARFSPRQGMHSRYLYLRKHEGPARARLIATGGRVLRAKRGGRKLVSALRHRDRSRLTEARFHLGLAAYDPRRAPVLPPRAGHRPLA